MTDKFGDLRSLAQQPTSPHAWGALLNRAQQLQTMGDFTPEMLAYLKGRARQFPDAMRVVPRGWTRRLCSGQTSEVFSLCHHLQLGKMTLQAETGDALRTCAHLNQLETLRLSSAQADYLGVMGLVQAPWFQGLDALALYQCDLTSAAWDALADNMPWSLRRLEITGCAVPASSWGGLLSTGALEEAALEHSRRSQAPEISEALLSLASNPALRSLSLIGSTMQPRALLDFLVAPHPHLRTLHLRGLEVGTLRAAPRISIEALEGLWNNPSLSNLTDLQVSKMRVAGRGLSRGEAATWCPERLDLRDTEWADLEIWARLATRGRLSGVRHLDLSGCQPHVISELLCVRGWDGLETLVARGVAVERVVERAFLERARFPALRRVESLDFEM